MSLPELNTRLEALQEKWNALSPTLDFESKKERIKDLEKEMSAEGFWNDQSKAQQVSQEAAHLAKFVEEVTSLE